MRRRGLRVLFVEDDEADAFYARRVLATQGGGDAFELEHVSRLGDAKARVAQAQFDVALIDLGLPDAPGVGAVQSLRHANPRLPIVVITAPNDDTAGAQSIRMGADDFLSKKDVSGQGLARMLELAVERRRSMLEPLSNIAEPVVVVACTGEVRMANLAAEALLARSETEMLGAPMPVAIPDGDHAEVSIETPAGTRVCEVRRRAIAWHDEDAHLLSFRDVTDRHAAADLRQRLEHSDKLASIGQMAAGVAHEINNPAMAIKASIELLREGSIGDPDREILDHCEEAVRRIHRIVAALSAFSRMEEAHIGAVDLNEIVEVACRLARNELRHRAVLELDLGELPAIDGDRDRLTQVVLNLLVNAAHAIDESSNQDQRISIKTRREGDEAVLRVRDTGRGIPEADLQRIFEPFYTTKRAGLGTGLGLSLSTDIVRQHQGTLTAESQLGVGTEMQVRLPCTSVIVAEATEDDLAIPEARPVPSDRLRVLVVDDDDLVRRSCARLLASRHEVVEAYSAEDALEILAEGETFDAVLSDIMMPGLDGPALFERATERYPALRERFAFFTGGVFTPRAREFIERMDVVVVQKPVDKRRLIACVEELARRGRMEPTSPESD